MTAFNWIRRFLDLFRRPGGTDRRGRKKLKRQVAAAVFRGSGADCELMLITSRDSGRWIVPKGWIEDGEDGAAAAVREVWEEAGLVVEALAGGPVGHYRYLKERRRRAVVCDVDVYMVKLVEQKDHWPERDQRRRKWVPVASAIGMIDETDLRDVIRNAVRRHKAA